MYLLKARERLPDVEREEARERRRRDLGIPDLHIIQHGFDREEAERIPDKGAKLKCKYIGSFRVHPPEGLTGRSLQSAIGGFIGEVIRNINPKRVQDSLSIALHINRHGVKIFKSKKLFMAYPLRRVLNCQMSPNPPLFGMMCKDVVDGTSIHYCHVFQLTSPEEASELNQLMSHAFKVAFAHNNLRNSLERPSASAKSTSKGAKPKKTQSSSSQQQQQQQQQQQLPNYDSLTTPSVVPNAPSYDTLLDDLPSYESLATTSFPVVPAGAVPTEATPLQGRRSGSISGAHVTVEGLQEEVRRLQQKLHETEDRLNSISPEDDAVFELTLDLSSFEEQLKIKQQQLETLLLMAPEEQSESSGGAMGGQDRSYEDRQLLQDAEWYQAALPKEFVMSYLMEEPVGSFVVRDSASNPGCLAISVKIPDGNILHYLIVRDEKGWYLQGSDRHHPNLTSLILHHGSTIDHIPCCLTLGATNQLSDTLQTDGPEDEEDISDEEMIRQLAQLSVLHPT